MGVEVEAENRKDAAGDFENDVVLEVSVMPKPDPEGETGNDAADEGELAGAESETAALLKPLGHWVL